eukprot:gene16631-22051_t
MADLRTFLADLGHGDVKTLLASGNAVFAADETDAATLEAELERAAKATLGLDTAWLLRSHAELAAIVQANPFADAAAAHPNHLLVHFHRDPVPAALLDALVHDGPERLRALGRELFVDYPEDIGHSKLPQAPWRASEYGAQACRTDRMSSSEIDGDAFQRPVAIARGILAERIAIGAFHRRGLWQWRIFREIGGRLNMCGTTTH